MISASLGGPGAYVVGVVGGVLTLVFLALVNCAVSELVVRAAAWMYSPDPELRAAQRDDWLRDIEEMPAAERPSQAGSYLWAGLKQLPMRWPVARSTGPRGRLLRAVAGCDEEVLQLCPEEGFKFAGLGAVILGTGCMSAVITTLALSIVFGQMTAYTVIGGVMWGLFVLALDRWLVATTGTDWRHFIPRIVLAIFFGLVIAEPVALMAFDDAVAQGIDENTASAADDYRALLNRCNPMIVESSRLAFPSENCDNAPLALDRPAMSSTGSKSTTTDRTAAERRAHDYNEARASAIDQLVRDRVAELSQPPGLARRMDTLSDLMLQNSTIMLARIALALFLVVMETSPALVRMTTSGGTYDRIIADQLARAIKDGPPESNTTDQE